MHAFYLYKFSIEGTPRKDPQEERRVIRINNPNHFKRDTTYKTIKLVNQAKQYGLVFDKRMIDP